MSGEGQLLGAAAARKRGDCMAEIHAAVGKWRMAAVGIRRRKLRPVQRKLPDAQQPTATNRGEPPSSALPVLLCYLCSYATYPAWAPIIPMLPFAAPILCCKYCCVNYVIYDPARGYFFISPLRSRCCMCSYAYGTFTSPCWKSRCSRGLELALL